MHKKDLLNYNLSQISDLDKKISNLRKEKEKYVKKNEKKDNMYDLFSKLQERLFLTIIIVALSLFVYNEVENPIITILVTALIIIVFNIIIIFILKRVEPDYNYSKVLMEYDININEFIQKRNTYISLYNYAMYGDKALYNNIKSKICSGKSYEYDIINNLNYSKDSYEYTTIIEMKTKEKTLINVIKNKVSFLLKFSHNYENLSKEQLNTIQRAL